MENKTIRDYNQMLIYLQGKCKAFPNPPMKGEYQKDMDAICHDFDKLVIWSNALTEHYRQVKIQSVIHKAHLEVMMLVYKKMLKLARSPQTLKGLADIIDSPSDSLPLINQLERRLKNRQTHQQP